MALRLKQSRLKKISFIFVPWHAGVTRNKDADRFARMATVKFGQVMDQANILNAVRGRVS